MKLTQVLSVLKGALADSVAERYSARTRHLTRQDMIRNVLLDAAEINEVFEGMKWPSVEKMRRRIIGW